MRITNMIRVSLLCIYPALYSLYAGRVGFKTVWFLICVVAFAYYLCSLVNKQQTIQKSSDLQRPQLRQIGKYPRRKLFDFIVVQYPVRLSFNYFSCVFYNLKNDHRKTTSSQSILVLSLLLLAAVLTSSCTGNLTCVHGKLVIF